MVAPTARSLRHALLILGGLGLLSANPILPDQGSKAPVFSPQLIPRCGADLPLDAGQVFAGPIYLLDEDRVSFFEALAPSDPSFGKAKWKLVSTQHLKVRPPSAGLNRARVKWRDGALWMRAGRQIFKKDLLLNKWFLRANPKVDFNDFDVDIKGRILLIGTADPIREKYRALLEVVATDGTSVETIADYPDAHIEEWLPQLPPMVGAALVSGYESIQINDYIVLYNPMSRRLFVYRSVEGKFREIQTELRQRTFKNLETVDGKIPTWPEDLCWQVLPRNAFSAWLVIPALAHPPRDERAEAGRPRGLRVFSLDLDEAQGGEPSDLPGLEGPVFVDAQGVIKGMKDALASYQDNHPPKVPPIRGVPAAPERPKSR